MDPGVKESADIIIKYINEAWHPNHTLNHFFHNFYSLEKKDIIDGKEIDFTLFDKTSITYIFHRLNKESKKYFKAKYISRCIPCIELDFRYILMMTEFTEVNSAIEHLRNLSPEERMEIFSKREFFTPEYCILSCYSEIWILSDKYPTRVKFSESQIKEKISDLESILKNIWLELIVLELDSKK